MHGLKDGRLNALMLKAGAGLHRGFAWLCQCIPPSLHDHPVALMRAQNVMLAYLICLAVIPPFGFLYWWLADSTSAAACLIAFMLVSVAPCLLRLPWGLGLMREWLTLTAFVLLYTLSLHVGGATSPTLIWFAACPLIGLLAGGVVPGLVWMVLSLLAIASEYWIAQAGWQLPAITVRDMPLLYTVSATGLALTLFIDYLIYERINARLLRQLNEANAHINEMAIRDELTGAFNRRELLRLAEQEKLRADRSGTTFYLCLMDIDHFKQINDTYGHGSGDQVLKAIADAVRLQMRRTDYFGRYGGEEFVAILPQVIEEEARPLAERIRETVAALDLGLPAQRRVTVSIGIAAYHHGETVSQVIDRADEALYRAKHTGRNTVVMAAAADAAYAVQASS